jgi:hypothetical protein
MVEGAKTNGCANKNIWFGEQKQWLGEQKPIVLGTKNYCYGNKMMIVGTITSGCGN